MRTKKKNWPARFETPLYQAPAEPLLHGIRVLWIGHSTTLIQTPHLNIITDLDLQSLHALVDRQRTAPPRILVGRGVGPVLKNAGLSSYAELDWDESVMIKDAKVYFVEAIHTSRRGLWDTNNTLWGSFLIDSRDGRIYFAGDSAYGTHFRRIYEKYGAPRVSLLPIGAYEPRWFMSRMHMDPDEAVRAHIDLHSESSIGIHFGLIDNAGEGYEAPVDDLIAARRAHGVDATSFVAPHYGQVFRY